MVHLLLCQFADLQMAFCDVKIVVKIKKADTPPTIKNIFPTEIDFPFKRRVQFCCKLMSVVLD